MRLHKAFLVFATLIAVVAARADITYSNISATIRFEDQSVFDLAVGDHGFELDFSAAEKLMYVASQNSDHTSALIEISYDATSDEGITGLGLIFSGWAFGDGFIAYREVVFDESDNEIASASGLITGDLPFTQVDQLKFEGSHKTYSVQKAFVLGLGGIDIGNEAPGRLGPSLASIGLIEQNAVPEPATLGALAAGALGLLARRRRS